MNATDQKLGPPPGPSRRRFGPGLPGNAARFGPKRGLGPAIAPLFLVLTSPALAFAQTPAPLPSGRLFPRLVFESPWSIVLAVVLLLVGVGLGRLAALSPAGRRAPLRGLALTAAAAGIALATVQALVHTPKEVIAARTRTLVEAVAAADVPKLRELLTDDCTATYFGAPSGIGKEQILARVTAAFGSGDAADASIGVLQTVADNDRFGRAQLRVTVTHDLTQAIPVGSWWHVDWERGSDGRWRASEVRLVSAPGMPGP